MLLLEIVLIFNQLESYQSDIKSACPRNKSVSSYTLEAKVYHTDVTQ